MPKLKFLHFEPFVVANIVQQLAQLRFGANSLNVQLIVGQIHRDTKSLLERCIVERDGNYFVVLTRTIQIQIRVGFSEVGSRAGDWKL